MGELGEIPVAVIAKAGFLDGCSAKQLERIEVLSGLTVSRVLGARPPSSGF